eukprot:5795355-Amphidinium_carterae.1
MPLERSTDSKLSSAFRRKNSASGGSSGVLAAAHPNLLLDEQAPVSADLSENSSSCSMETLLQDVALSALHALRTGCLWAL